MVSTRNNNEDTAGENLTTTNEILKNFAEHWKLMLCAALLFTAAAWVYCLFTPPEYERESTFMMKYYDTNVFVGEKLKSAQALPYATGISVQNALELFKSPWFIERVVRELRLQDRYSAPGRFGRQTDLYGRAPVAVDGIGEDRDQTISFRVTLLPDHRQVELDRFRIDGEEKPGSVRTAFGEAAATPAGELRIYPTEHLTAYDRPSVVYTRVPIRQATETTAKSLKITKSAEQTDIISCVCRDIAPLRAADIANAVPVEFSRLWRQWNEEDAAKVDSVISRRLAVHSDNLQTIEDEIADYLRQSGSLGSQAEAGSISDDMAKYNAMLVHNTIQLHIAQAIAAQTADDTQDGIPLSAALSAIENSKARTLIADYNQAVMARAAAMRAGAASHPAAAETDRKIAALREAIASTVESHIGTLQTDRRKILEKIDGIDRQIRRQAALERDLSQLRRDRDAAQSGYISLRSKQESRLMDVNNISDAVRLISSASGPDTPVSIPPAVILTAAFLCGGLLLPYLLLQLSKAVDTRVRDKAELERLSVPVIGDIPQLIKPRRADRLKIWLRLDYSSPDAPAMMVGRGQSAADEAFALLRDNIRLMTDGETATPVLLTTSYNSGSGKSFVTLNLGASLALGGKKTLLVDLDFRRASLSKCVRSPRKGAATYLNTPDTPLADLIAGYGDISGLDILPVGALPPNPAELLESDRLERMFGELRRVYDIIIVDSAPVNLVTDTALAVEQSATRTLFVVRAGLFDRRALPELSRLRDSGELPLLSFAVNGSRRR